jgi:hypothetical protein
VIEMPSTSPERELVFTLDELTDMSMRVTEAAVYDRHEAS